MNGPSPPERRPPGRVRSLRTVLARHAARVESRRALLRGLARAVGTTLLTALLAVPFAAAWGISHARVDDYLGPNRVRFSGTFSGEVQLDLGPIGNAYLPSPAAPVGVTVTVGSIGSSVPSLGSLFSEENLAAYVDLFSDPRLAVEGIVDRLEVDALLGALEAEAVLVLAFAVWRLRRQLLSPWVAQHVTRRRSGVVYVVVLALLAGSVLGPRTPEGRRFGVRVTDGTPLAALTVDSGVLADLLDRGATGITLLSGRQQRVVQTYIDHAVASLSEQTARFPSARPGESLLLGFSDLHCNQAMTDLIGRLAQATAPRVVLSSGDDTVNGTAVEKTCIRREAAIYPAVPFVVSSGNHDSDITEAQMRGDEMVVLDGKAVEEAGLRILGDDDPEHNIPFSQERTRDRAETEEQMATRLVDAARPRPVDVLLVHQPAASVVAMTSPDPPARLILWGHYHSQAGPTVVTHTDGSWTVGMQEGTAGGVQQPTITSFSTPFSPPLVNADVYFYYRDEATGLVTGVQPVHFTPDARVVIEGRISTGDLDALPPETRLRLSGTDQTPAPAPQSPAPSAAVPTASG